MRRPGSAGVAVIVALLCFAVGSTAQSFAGTSALRPDPVVSEWPAWPYRVSCESFSFDPITVFSSSSPAERGTRSSEKALRRFLAREFPFRLPRHNWRLAGERDGHADFLHGTPGAKFESGHELESFELRRVHRHWKMASYSSQCELWSQRHGRSAQPWFLAADQPPLTAETQQVRIDVGPGYCDGKSASEAEEPVFHEVTGKLLMTIWLRPPHVTGVQACEPPASEPPLIVDLPEPLGDRELLDGGVFPPRPAQAIQRTHVVAG